MNVSTSRGLLAAVMVMAVIGTAEAQPVVYDWIATDDVANWNVAANWDNPFDAVPDADSFEGESARINNGRTALANVAVPRVAGLEVTNGAVDIPAGGVVETVVDDLNNGGLSIGGAGNVVLSGNGQLGVAGDASIAGTMGITGPNARIQIEGDLSLTGTLAAGITDPDNHSVVNVAGEATLRGTLQVGFTDVTPSFGQSWNLVSAGSLSGGFNAIDASAAPTLGHGLLYRVAQENNTASLLVDNALILTVDRQNGSGNISIEVGAPIDITSYAMHSGNGLLSTDNWTTLADSGAAGEGWTVANPTGNHLAELNLSNSFSVAVKGEIDLGSPYNAGLVQPADEDVVFEYTTLDGVLSQGIVEYTGALNDLVLHVDPADGAAAIANGSKFIETPDITSYAVRSESEALTVGTWTSFADTLEAGSGWTEANPSSAHIAELNLEESTAFVTGTLIGLGKIFAPGSEQDLLFEYTTVAGELLLGTVQYGAIPSSEIPGDCNGDGVVDADDLDCVSDVAERDIVLAALNTLPGDLDGDGEVAFNDFLVLSGNFDDSTKLKYTEGDIDLMDGPQFADFLELSANFGQTPGAVAAAVPEPSAWVLLSVAGLALGGLRRGRGWRKE